MVPLMIVSFGFIFSKIKNFFKKYQETLETLNKTISENIIWSTLIRILNSQDYEIKKFEQHNVELRTFWFGIAKMFSLLIPSIILISNLSILAVLWFWWKDVISWIISIGDLSAYISYVNLLIMPIFILWFVFGNFSRAFISLERIQDIFDSNDNELIQNTSNNLIKTELKWDIIVENLSYQINEKLILKNISFNVKKWTKTAILWTTWAWKTILFLLLSRLIRPSWWKILIDWYDINEYDADCFYKSIWLVFQDSIIFNTSFEENIKFRSDVDDELFQKAIKTARLEKFIKNLSNWINTDLSERWTNISWWQKQRLSLARALAINPNILLLDDFTARVDIHTEQQILKNLQENYPNITLLSITQKIETIKDYDQIIFIIEWELIWIWTHNTLLANSIEYKQLYESQK